MVSDSLAGIRPYKNLTPANLGKLPDHVKHPQYAEIESEWELVRDCFLGSKQIKDKGEKYLPRLGGQDQYDYELYKRRALFFPITGKTVSSLSGFATLKPPLIEYPPEMEEYFKDTIRAYQFMEILMQSVTEILLMGRIGHLIDAPTTPGNPYICSYTAENIVNWKVDDLGRLRWTLLHEVVYDEVNSFEYVPRHQYRLLTLDNSNKYAQVLYNEKMEKSSEIVPTFNGRTLNYIPFTIIGATGVHVNIDRPPMLDIATINISHYLSSADLEWGRHFTGLPTPVISGVDSSTQLKIGGTTAWVLPQPEAKAYFLEFTGQGLQSLEKAMSEKINLMASMSARLVDSNTKGSEAAETVRLRYMAETASLVQVLSAVENGLNTIYKQLAVMVGADPDSVRIELHRDVLSISLHPTELRELFSAYFQGGISKETLVYNLRRGNYIDPERRTEDELSAIRSPAPPPTQPQPQSPVGN